METAKNYIQRYNQRQNSTDTYDYPLLTEQTQLINEKFDANMKLMQDLHRTEKARLGTVLEHFGIQMFEHARFHSCYQAVKRGYGPNSLKG